MNRIYKIAKKYGKGTRARTCAAAFLAAFALTGVMGMSEAQAQDFNSVNTNALNSKYNLSVGTAAANGTMPFFVNSNGAFYAAKGNLVVDKDGNVAAGSAVLNNGVFTGKSALRDGELLVGDASGNYSQITPNSAKLGQVTIDDKGYITGANYVQTNALNSKYNFSVGTAAANGTMPFFVNSTGDFYAANNKFSVNKDGKVTATAGEIGGVTVNKGLISNGAAKIALYGDSGVAGMVNGKGASIYMQDGNTVINSKVAIDKDGKVTGVAAGAVTADSKDAVNGGQLYATNQLVKDNAGNISLLSNSIDKLDNRVDKVGAGAAALAALHPLDFDPEDKWDFAAGYGNYSGASAVALGAYYRPNEDTMFSVGGSFGNGENMVNAGVSLKLGQSSHAPASKAAMEKKISSLSQEVEELKAAIADLRAAQTKAKDATEKDAQKK
ncbi:MAG: hypothetical protein EGQ38_03420 [Dialister sp.]|nr:hypothetical protein [Dialister sp.]